ncbi:nuclear transport factor 2 family protein [Kutzneria sp. CA-103260]|uniref:nuclear transport factor 2 family protein n=1 Tax=Kutzneria sp. CA-103260 TaxID=2802641 RepID=UPI001BF0D1B5|nr:nuclear transport factor 2 family protein [Kutzneria sp. CA-103260]QUQ71887.1 SnoaL-like domain protein [Kutzneria sp. CA-103260]
MSTNPATETRAADSPSADTPAARAIAQLRAAVEQGDHAGIVGLFREDIVFHSPVKFRPFEGLPTVGALFAVLLRTFEDFRYVGELSGDVEGDAESRVLVFRARVGDKQIHGIDMIQFDDQGKIATFTVMVRPQSAAMALSEAVFAGLVADGVVPAPQGGQQ